MVGGIALEDYLCASNSMSDELIDLMCTCFGNPRWFVEFIFENGLDLNNCYIYVKENKIVSALHVIPIEVILDNISLKSGYIYGACTLPEHRKQGYMSNLLRFVQGRFVQNNYDCLCLRPARPKLKRFYSKFGYWDFFKSKQFSLSNQELTDYISNSKQNLNKNSEIDFSCLEKSRNEFYNSKNHVKYNLKYLNFLSDLYKCADGGAVTFENNHVYCTCNVLPELKLLDFTCECSKTKELLREVYHKFPDFETYTIETHPDSKFLDTLDKNKHKLYYNSMILCLNQKTEELARKAQKQKKFPYLGITFE